MADTAQPVREFVLHAPGAALRPQLAWCTGYRDKGVAPAVHRGLPSPWLTFIVTIDEPLVIAAHPDPAQSPATFDVLVGGLHTSPALIRHDGAQSGIQLAVSPLAARALLGFPAGELASIDVHGADVFGAPGDRLHEQIRELRDWPARFAFLDDFLLSRLRAADGRAGISAEVRYAWSQLLSSGGNAPVAQLAAQTGWSERHLRSRFRAETGLGPKEAGRVIRFDQVRRELRRRAEKGGPLDLGGLAAAGGYFDQAHMDRDFRLLAGCPPTAWVTEE